MIGRTISHYEITEKLGEGGMGVVYKARDSRLKRFVALKVLPPEKVAHPERKQRFVREARAASALNHPNIVTVYDIDQSDGIDFIAMEYVEGKTLDEVIGRKGLKLNEALKYAVQIADALARAHAVGIVHRDLKPGNVMVTAEGRVKVLDFGLAKLTEPAAVGPEDPTVTAGRSTESGRVVGTAGYMSPEQAEGEKVDARSDIFSFGSVLYEMLTGRRAFRRDNPTLTLAAILHQEPPALPEGAPSELERVLTRCLRKDPARRFQTMADLKVALEELKEEWDSGKLAPTAPGPSKWRRWFRRAAFATLAVLAAIQLYRWLPQSPAGPFTRMEPTRLTDSGKASAAAISPDGKFVAHALSDGAISSLSLRNATTGSNVPMLRPTQGVFSNLEFSRDGNFLYYLFDTGTPAPTLYMMPVPGGNPKKLAAFADIGTARLSPDRKRLVFTRWVGTDSSLFIANVDVSGQWQVAGRKFPDVFLAPVWSPDGKTIAYSASSYRGGFSSRLAAMPADGGAEKRFGARPWYDISILEWMPHGHGLIILASEQPGDPHQLWYVSYPDGDARRITNDLNDYSGLSLTGDSSALVTVQGENATHIWVGPVGDAASAREITGRLTTSDAHLDWVGDSNIVFNAPDSKQRSRIWIAAADGTSERQLTEEGPYDGLPSACGDGRRIVFLSYRAGGAHIWRLDLDGSSARQLTSGEGEAGPSCSPDGTWITYGSLDPKTYGVWRMPIDGGSAVLISNEYGWSSISPDGKLVLVNERFAVTRKVSIIPAKGGQPVKTFDLGQGRWQWSADSKSLLFWKTSGGVSNVWRQPLDGGEAKQVTSFRSDRISDVAESRDGKKLAVARYSTTSDVVMIRDLK
jgi:serine/threonine protein kinase